jgi:hypothetical protein
MQGRHDKLYADASHFEGSEKSGAPTVKNQKREIFPAAL